MNTYTYLGIAVVVVVIVAVMAIRALGGKSKLPPLPAFGPLPLADLPKYFALKEPALAWEAVRGWDLNERPSSFTAPALNGQAILTGRVLDFCSGRSGRLKLEFNFLVAAIKNVEFDPSALPEGLAPAGFGVATIHTPSGETLMITSAAFVRTLKDAIAQAQNA